MQVLFSFYETGSPKDLVGRLPGRNIKMIQCKANALGLKKHIPTKRTPEQVREAKRSHMAQRRLSDPDAAKAYQKAHRLKNKEQINAVRRQAHKGRLFWVRSLKIKGVRAKDLAKIWKAQRGLCALTGRKMDRSAQIDHKIPLAKGGGDSLGNLQWTTAEANRAKRDLLDTEFVELCADVVSWIGKRMKEQMQ